MRRPLPGGAFSLSRVFHRTAFQCLVPPRRASLVGMGSFLEMGDKIASMVGAACGMASLAVAIIAYRNQVGHREEPRNEAPEEWCAVPADFERPNIFERPNAPLVGAVLSTGMAWILCVAYKVAPQLFGSLDPWVGMTLIAGAVVLFGLSAFPLWCLTLEADRLSDWAIIGVWSGLNALAGFLAGSIAYNFYMHFWG